MYTIDMGFNLDFSRFAPGADTHTWQTRWSVGHDGLDMADITDMIVMK